MKSRINIIEAVNQTIAYIAVLLIIFTKVIVILDEIIRRDPMILVDKITLIMAIGPVISGILLIPIIIRIGRDRRLRPVPFVTRIFLFNLVLIVNPIIMVNCLILSITLAPPLVVIPPFILVSRKPDMLLNPIILANPITLINPIVSFSLMFEIFRTDWGLALIAVNKIVSAIGIIAIIPPFLVINVVSLIMGRDYFCF